ncbi:hypothetical protein [Roseobacter sp.]|uniref:hypothetical protein n=1 Tax=Roseobacter sp. TaxID=1907202 RepID=UPI0025DB4F49|nr:hypothetical protein [Roseobacter sp.]
MKHVTINKTRITVLGLCLATLSACAYPAGSQLDNGNFGDATMHNMMVQACKTNGLGAGKGGKYGSHLADPVVVLDPASTPGRKIYRVHCDGRLDGKYANIIYNEYVGSATQTPTVSETDGGDD